MSNFTNNRWLSVITLLLLTANIVTLALLWTNKKAGGRGEGVYPPPQGQVFEFLTNELKLDASQQETYRKLRDEHRGGQKAIQDSIRKAKDEFFTLRSARSTITTSLASTATSPPGSPRRKTQKM